MPEPCDSWFALWWRCLLRRHAGIATPADLMQGEMGWQMSMAIMQRMEGWK
ncbi:hypothetical protein [Modicisalibacter coralii]|uniref:hypothetical protein n=1 Tax=Modicisalibacter coralii TaxID=2304602 RepID=UPI00139687AA|nr:hypothetical protein [Halomonas coralii]